MMRWIMKIIKGGCKSRQSTMSSMNLCRATSLSSKAKCWREECVYFAFKIECVYTCMHVQMRILAHVYAFSHLKIFRFKQNSDEKCTVHSNIVDHLNFNVSHFLFPWISLYLAHEFLNAAQRTKTQSEKQ